MPNSIEPNSAARAGDCMPFAVYVDDNFHFMNETARVAHGRFATSDAAIAACKRIVDDDLAASRRPGMTAGELFNVYCMFGADPFILPAV
jgi:hypothetical protein